MVIVYISLAVIFGSLGYLGFVVFKTLKAAKPSIENLQNTAARVQLKSDAIKQETDKLAANQQQLMTDIEYKKAAVDTVVSSVKQTPVAFKGLMKVKPVAALELTFKVKQWQQRRRKLSSTQTEF
jgi:uncharacterized protein YoxC